MIKRPTDPSTNQPNKQTLNQPYKPANTPNKPTNLTTDRPSMNVHLAKATRERLNKKMLCWSFVGLAPFNIEIQKAKAEKIIIATKTNQQFAIWLKKLLPIDRLSKRPVS